MTEDEIHILAEHGLFKKKRLRGELEETHISWVILTKTFVFKIKKPLKLSFLNFSTLRLRKRYCERELQLNQRFSPIYLNVLPVRKRNRGTWTIGGALGKLVDYAVVMKRLDSSKRMDKLLQKKKVDQKSIVALSKVVSSFHKQAEIIQKKFEVDNAREAFNDIKSIIPLTKRILGREYAQIIEECIRWSDSFLKEHEYRIKQRIEAGFWRDLHGDLHSGNIFLYGKPILFDCIEFNDSYRQNDILDEISFLCMDLEAYGEPRLSQLLIKEYERREVLMENDADRRLMKYYKCYRANVRAKVHALRVELETDKNQDLELHRTQWCGYLRLVRSYIK
jgi:aminoglycoside phosphotransferase family enzyme